MSRRQAVALIAGSLLLAVLLGALWALRGRGSGREGPIAAEPGVESGDLPALTLYFPRADGRLGKEERAITLPDDGDEKVRRIVAEILAGPRDGELFPPFAEGTSLRSAHRSADGLLYLDLGTPEQEPGPAVGSRQELLMAYSLVNSLCENLPDTRGVVVLWNGVQRVTFAGNLDTTHPLVPDHRLVAP